MKLMFYGKDYFDYRGNTFDLFMAVLMLIFLILSKSTDNLYLICLYNICNCVKILVLFNYVESLHSIFQVMVLAFPVIISFGILLLIVIYLFTVAGVFLFAGIKPQLCLEVHANFDNFLNAFLQVFRMLTFDAWAEVMHDMMRQKSQFFNCVENPTYNDTLGESIGCGYSYAPIYCILLILALPFLFLNLLIAIISDSMTNIKRLSQSVLSDSRLEAYRNIWKKRDPNATGYIEYLNVWNILSELDEPLGASEKDMHSRYYAAITLWMLDLPIYFEKGSYKHYVQFHDVLEALVKRTLYKPQTLLKIYDNYTKDMLMKGLEELWDQKAQLSMDDEKYIKKIENLRYYSEKKKHLQNYKYKSINIKFSSVVWMVLTLEKKLKKKVKIRTQQMENCETDNNRETIQNKDEEGLSERYEEISRLNDEISDLNITQKKNKTIKKTGGANQTNEKIIQKCDMSEWSEKMSQKNEETSEWNEEPNQKSVKLSQKSIDTSQINRKISQKKIELDNRNKEMIRMNEKPNRSRNQKCKIISKEYSETDQKSKEVSEWNAEINHMNGEVSDLKEELKKNSKPITEKNKKSTERNNDADQNNEEVNMKHDKLITKIEPIVRSKEIANEEMKQNNEEVSNNGVKLYHSNDEMDRNNKNDSENNEAMNQRDEEMTQENKKLGGSKEETNQEDKKANQINEQIIQKDEKIPQNIEKENKTNEEFKQNNREHNDEVEGTERNLISDFEYEKNFKNNVSSPPAQPEGSVSGNVTEEIIRFGNYTKSA